MLEDFILEIGDSLSKDLCDDIVFMFELEENYKYAGFTAGGVNQAIKNTVDFIIPKKTDEWNRVETTLNAALQKGINTYVDHLTTKFNYKYIKSTLLTEGFQIQKYSKNEGKYIFHNDFAVQKIADNTTARTLAFIFYLNDVIEGGETEFINSKVIPKKGKLVLFPASWIFPHKGNMPLSSDKYIITNWLCEQTFVIT